MLAPSYLKPSEKRALATNEPNASPSTPERKRVKRRRVSDHDVSEEQSIKTPTRSKGTELDTDSNSKTLKTRRQKYTLAEQRADETMVIFADKPASRTVALTGDVSSHWEVTTATGGRFADMDPIFTADEEYLILGLENAVQVYSASTSHSVRSFQPPESQRVTGYKLSPNDPEYLYISAMSGVISKWEWASGQETTSWASPHRISELEVYSTTIDDSAHDVLVTIQEADDGIRRISQSHIGELDSTGLPHWDVVLETSQNIWGLKVIDNGAVLLAFAGEKLLIGFASATICEGSDGREYVWRELGLPASATCFDVREGFLSSQPPSKPSQSMVRSKVFDLVVGESRGSLLIYHDLANSLLQRERRNPAELRTELISNRLHWHRNSVQSVKWSKDGNYIISGGQETVMVLWQLDTGRKHFLPHLSAAICNIMLSPSGASYAVKLADNSVMVLSTSELQPTASIGGLQFPLLGFDGQKRHSQNLKTLTDKKVARLPPPRLVAPTLHPANPDHLLLASLSPQTTLQKGPQTTAMLQTFDIRAGRQISRQALARTNVTVVNTGPEGTEITSPDLKFLKVDRDGHWLATVDEWNQPLQDARALHLSGVEKGQTVARRREMFLKFWAWNKPAGEWELVTRIDAPHSQASYGSENVLDMAADPEGPGFATVGNDGAVKIWAPRARHLHGSKQQQQDPNTRQLLTWACRRIVPLEESSRSTARSTSKACLGFSEDGSVLAVCWKGGSTSDGDLVYMIATHTGKIHCCLSGLFSGSPRGVGFIGRYLVVVSNQLVVWNTVANRLEYTVSLIAESTRLTVEPLLALNHRCRSFAIVCKNVSESEADAFLVAVFSPQSAKPIFSFGLENQPAALLADPLTGGYIVIDETAQIRKLSPGANSQLSSVSDEISAQIPKGLGNIFGVSVLPEDLDSGKTNASMEMGALDRQADKGGSLSGVFDSGPSFALPRLNVLFKEVVDLFVGGED